MSIPARFSQSNGQHLVLVNPVLSLCLCTLLLLPLCVVAADWQRINPGGGGAFNSIGAGPDGLLIATSDLGGAFLSRDSGEEWEAIGDLSHGLMMKHVQAVAFHPINNSIILLSGERTGSGQQGESTGISRSTDRGRHFSPVSFRDEIGATSVAKSVAFAPSNGNIVYASVRSRYNQADSRIFRSDDAGATFRLAGRPANVINAPAIMKLIVHPDNPDVILALSSQDRFADATNAVLLSTDGGANWSRVANGQSSIIDIVFHPDADSLGSHPVYLSSVDGAQIGRTYYCADLLSRPNDCVEIHSQQDNRGFLWPQPGNPRQIRIIDSDFSWYWDNSSNSHPVAWRVFHDGTSWNSETLAYNQDYAGNSADTWRAGWARRHAIFNTILGGETAKTLGFDLTYGDPDTIYWVTIQFAFKGRYADSGATRLDFLPAYTVENPNSSDLWQSTGIDNITATLIEANDTDPNTLYIGLQDIGCWVSRDAGTYWKSCNYFHDYLDPLPDEWRGIDFQTGVNESNVAFGGNVYALLSDPANPVGVWMSSSPGQRGNQMLAYSANAGQDWIHAADMPRNSHDVYGLSLDPTDQEHETLLVTIDGEVYRTQDGKNTKGAHWNRVPSSCNGGCRVTAVDDNGTYYAGGEVGLFYSRDQGSSWTTFAGPLEDSFAINGDSVYQTADWRGIGSIRPAQDLTGVILVSVFQSAANNTDKRGGVYRCTVTAASCVQLLGDADMATPYLRDVAIDPLDSDILYASSSSAYTGPSYDNKAHGIYHSIDGGSTWELANEGLSWSSAFPLAISRAAPKVVYTGSIGPGYYRRVFESQTPTPPTKPTAINYHDAFQGPTPASGWSYLWNAHGPIGDDANYADLVWNGVHYDSDGSSGRDASEFDYGSLSADGGHPGRGSKQQATVDRYAIAAYQIDSAGLYRIEASEVATDCVYSKGLDLRVYVNDRLISSIEVEQGETMAFDGDLGALVNGDRVYVAVGPRGHDGCDGFTLDYTLALTSVAPIARIVQ
jgi:photosystem II stability/assembly factor-like uncharacterized protein